MGSGVMVGASVGVGVNEGMGMKVGVEVSSVEVSGDEIASVTESGETVGLELKLQAVEMKNRIPNSSKILLIDDALLPFHKFDGFDVGHGEQG